MKQRIRLSESDLHKVIKESVRRVLKEGKYVNNIPWKDSQKYKDGYQAFLDHEKEKEDFWDDVINHNYSDEEYSKKRHELKNSPAAKMADKWKKGNYTHGERANKRYFDETKENDLWWNRPESLKKFQVQRIKDLGDEWKNSKLGDKLDWMSIAKDDWFEMPTERNADREYHDRYYLDDDY